MELSEYRIELDALDRELVSLFSRRMRLSREIGAYKMARSLPVLDEEREREKLDAVERLGAPFGAEARALYTRILELSRGCQEKLSAGPRCGLLGEKLGHSYSPQIHAELADYPYVLYEKSPEDVEAFLRSDDWDGLNVTIPYKKTALPLCDSLSETARAIGSVNTLLRRADGSIYGDNTDAYGFRLLLRQNGMDPRGKKALVLGSGGAAAMVRVVLQELGAAPVVIISRRGPENYENLERHADAGFLVNATPVGMYPGNGAAPVDLTAFPACEGVVDLIYNPARTALLLQAERLGIPCAGGLLMLVAQAKRSAELFSGRPMDDAEIGRITELLIRRERNIVLVGMPGCGKTAMAELLGKRLGRPVYDSDAELVRRAGMSIPEIFAKEGEEGFRRRETAVLRDLGKCSGAILATGGGCVTRAENYDLLHQNGVIVWRKRALETLAREGRPLTLSRGLDELYEERRALYERFADFVVEETASLEEAGKRIEEELA